MHNPTNWQNYPDTTTPITASELLRIDTLACRTDIIDYMLDSILPHLTVTQTLTAESYQLLGHWCLFPEGFESGDGIMIKLNGEFIAPSKITINTLQGQLVFDSSIAFAVGDVMTFNIYKPHLIYPMTQADYDDIQSPDEGTLYVIREEPE